MKKTILLALVFLATSLNAQRLSLSANALECANFGTLNAEMGFALTQHLSVTAGTRYNPWTFGNDDSGYTQNRSLSFAAGVRWWTWNVNSGWWFSFKGQWEQYNRSLPAHNGRAEEGDALGAGFSLGYALMLSRHLNIDFGLGAWGGTKDYVAYACPRCGRIVDSGRKGFIRPNDVQASIVYIF